MKAPVRIVTLLAASLVGLLATAGAAVADTPAGGDWVAAPERSTLELLLLFGGGTVASFVLVALFGLLTARNNYEPPEPGTDLVRTSGNAPVQH